MLVNREPTEQERRSGHASKSTKGAVRVSPDGGVTWPVSKSTEDAILLIHISNAHNVTEEDSDEDSFNVEPVQDALVSVGKKVTTLALDPESPLTLQQSNQKVFVDGVVPSLIMVFSRHAHAQTAVAMIWGFLWRGPTLLFDLWVRQSEPPPVTHLVPPFVYPVFVLPLKLPPAWRESLWKASNPGSDSLKLQQLWQKRQAADSGIDSLPKGYEGQPIFSPFVETGGKDRPPQISALQNLLCEGTAGMAVLVASESRKWETLATFATHLVGLTEASAGGDSYHSDREREIDEGAAKRTETWTQLLPSQCSTFNLSGQRTNGECHQEPVLVAVVPQDVGPLLRVSLYDVVLVLHEKIDSKGRMYEIESISSPQVREWVKSEALEILS